MIKNIKINDPDSGEEMISFRLVSSGATPIFYSNIFGRDFFKDFSGVFEFAQAANDEKQKGSDMEKIISLFDSGLILKFLDFAYIYAYTNNRNIGSEEDWLDGFEVFPILDILEEMIELMMRSLTVKKTFATNTKRTKPSTRKVSSTSRKNQD